MTVYRHSGFSVLFPLCFVHVGKAAGSSVSCGLGLTYADCEGLPRDRLPHTHFIHMRRNNCPKDTATYAVALRNPLVRLQSWFDFEKDIVPTRGKNAQAQKQAQTQRALLFRECYPTFGQMVLEGLRPLSSSTISAEHPREMSCPERAWAAVMGLRAFSYHEWYNYEYYWTVLEQQQYLLLRNDSTESMPKLYALRTEHLADDWNTLSREPLFRPVNRRIKNRTVIDAQHTSVTFLMDNPQARQHLCQALCHELQFYKQFLGASDNLDDHRKGQSLQELQTYCPSEKSLEVRECPSLPNISPIRVTPRQYRTEVKKRLYETTK